MNLEKSTLQEMAELALSFEGDFEVFELDCFYYDGHIVGPNSRWLDKSGEKVGWSNQLIRAAGKVYLRDIDPEMRIEWKANRANFFVLRVRSIDDIQCEIGFDESQESRRHQELREELGEVQYQELYGQSNDGTIGQEPEEIVDHQYSEQDLYTHLYHTVTADLPENWKSVTIRFSVNTDGAYKNLEADYLLEEANGASQTFEPAETFGPLNAMDKLRELSDEEPWQSATFYLYPGGQIGFKAGDDA